jgi:hypothetical protein
MKHLILAVAFAAVAAVLGTSTASAVSLRVSFAEMAQSADLVFVGTVTSQTCRTNAAGTMVFTDATFGDVEIVSATERSRQRASRQITLTFAGGTVGDLQIDLSDSPRVVTGRRYLLFALDDGRVYTSPLAGCEQGLFEVVRDRQTAEEYVVTAGGKAVLGFAEDDLVATRKRVVAIEAGALVLDQSSEAHKSLVEAPYSAEDVPARSHARSKTDSPARPVTLREFVDRICPDALRTPLTKRAIRTSSGGSFVKRVDGKIVRESLVARSQRAKAARAGTSVDRTPKVPTGDFGPGAASGTARADSASAEKTRGGDFGSCGWRTLPIVMEQYPEDWEEFDIANSCMAVWNTARRMFVYVNDDGEYAINGVSEFGGYPTNEERVAAGYPEWNPAAIGSTFSRSRPNCGEIFETDVFLNPAFDFTSDAALALADGSLRLLRPVLMHELGHVLGAQRSGTNSDGSTWGFPETYDYDVPTVMQGYVSDELVEDGRGLHAADVQLVRALYGVDTAAQNVGVESYFAEDGLNQATTNFSNYTAGESIDLIGVTVESMTWVDVRDVRLRFFLSTDRVLSSNDAQMGSYWFWNSFPGQGLWSGDLETKIPTVIGSGRYFILAVVTVDGFENDEYTWNNVTSFVDQITVQGSIVPVVDRIAASTRTDLPWKLKVSGSAFRSGMRAFIGDDGIEWTNTRFKRDGLFVLKGGEALMEWFPQGVDVPIRFVNPDGGETLATFRR